MASNSCLTHGCLQWKHLATGGSCSEMDGLVEFTPVVGVSCSEVDVDWTGEPTPDCVEECDGVSCSEVDKGGYYFTKYQNEYWNSEWLFIPVILLAFLVLYLGENNFLCILW